MTFDVVELVLFGVTALFGGVGLGLLLGAWLRPDPKVREAPSILYSVLCDSLLLGQGVAHAQRINKTHIWVRLTNGTEVILSVVKV